MWRLAGEARGRGVRVGKRDHSGSGDDLDIDVTDLRTGQPVANRSFGRRAPRSSTSAADPGDSGDTDEFQVTPLMDGGVSRPFRAFAPLARMPTRHRLVALAFALLVLLALAVLPATLASALPNAGTTLGGLLRGPTPTPTATLAVGGDSIYFQNAAPWGVLTVDGRAMLLSPEEIQLSPTQLARGHHTLAYRADPFPQLTYRLSVPADHADTCPVAAFKKFGDVRLLDLGATPDRLPADQQGALLAAALATTSEMDVSVQVATGDHYRDAASRTQLASAVLTAMLRHIPATSGASAAGDSCAVLCDVAIQPDPNGPYWLAHLPIRMAWQFADPSGHVVAADVPFVPFLTADAAFAEIDVAVRWNGGWSVTSLGRPSSDPTFCRLEVSALSGAPGSPYRGGGIGATMGEAPPDVQGCVAKTHPDLGVSDQATYLLRFGALLAADAQAHREFPSLPVANAHERAIAGRVTTQ